MKTGKVSESVLKRSVLKQIKENRNEVLQGAKIGEDCAILDISENKYAFMAMASVTIYTPADAARAVQKAANNTAVAGGAPVAVLLSILLPETAEEKELKTLMAEAQNKCDQLSLQIMGGHTEVLEALSRPVITAVCYGKEDQMVPAKRKGSQNPSGKKKEHSGKAVVMTKWAGLEGTAILARLKREELLTRYPAYLAEEAASFDRFSSIIPEAAVAAKSNVSIMHDVSGGGVFGALWELAEKAGVGLEIDLKKIPILQETVEVCNFFDINPYEMAGGGSLLALTEDGTGLVRALESEGIPAAVIGKVTHNNDRVVLNEEEKRFLEPVKPEHIYKILNGG